LAKTIGKSFLDSHLMRRRFSLKFIALVSNCSQVL
jgi:hypothetical protein